MEAQPLLHTASRSRAGREHSVGSMDVASAAVVVGAARRFRRRTTLLSKQHPGDTAPMGLLGSFVFLSNLITGPGMLGLPAAFRFGGWALASSLTLCFACCSALSCAFVAHACAVFKKSGVRYAMTPGAQEATLHHTPHVELETLVRGLGSHATWLAFQFFFLSSMLLMAISCIVVTSSSLDALSVLLLGNAWGLQVSPSVRWVSACDGEACVPFAAVAAADGCLLSVGYALTVALTAPLALVDVSESFQTVSYCISLVCLFWLILKFCSMAYAGSHADGGVLPPALGWNAGLALEVSFWSWLVTFAAPMWVEERDSALPIAPPLLYSFGHRAVLDLLLGLSGAAAFPHMPPTMLNVLDAVGAHPACGVLTRACGVGFVVFSLLPNITDYAMVASRNMECHIGALAANLLGVGVPFGTAWLFYFGASFSALVSSLAPLLNGAVQFLVPALLFLAYTRFDGAGGVVSLLDVRLRESTWRSAAMGIGGGAALLICLTYRLDALVSSGRIRSAHAVDTDYAAT